MNLEELRQLGWAPTDNSTKGTEDGGSAYF